MAAPPAKVRTLDEILGASADRSATNSPAVAQLVERLHGQGFLVTIDLEVEAAGAAYVAGVSMKTLRNWRDGLTGPESRMVRGRHWYSIASLARWLDEKGGTVLVGSVDECESRPRR